MMINDRQIIISAGSSRKSINWQPQTLMLSELYEKLRVPARGTETVAEYLGYKKHKQDELKDVGGFVGGGLNSPRRKANAVIGRDVITLDFDSIPAGATEEVHRRVAGLGCGYCIYSTRKHRPDAPRLRVILPLDRTATADEYEPVARRMAAYIGIEMADPSTFEASRLMYWPSCCSDSVYIYQFEDKPMLSVDGLLATYDNWRNVQEWPQVPGVQQTAPRLAAKQGNPTGKTGVVGAFCREYDVIRAMGDLIPGVYEPCDTDPGRYTFTGGSTTGGAVVYDDGQFLFSHHATDPCGGLLVNAFDLVRLHKFGELDDEAKEGTPNNRLPSYESMCEFAVSMPAISGAIIKERADAAVKDFEGLEVSGDEEDTNWRSLLNVSAQGNIAKTIDNIWVILEHDPAIKGKFALNAFAGRGEVLGALPWNSSDKRRPWEDNDNQGIYWYLEKRYGITGTAKVDGALSLHSAKHAFNDIQSYLSGLRWDGRPRLDTMLIDYLGAENTPYTKAVTRKAFTAAAARAMDPGCKFDSMTIFSGPQGLGKSTLLYKMSKGWFNDSIRSFEGKEASELLQGVWLVEVSELDAFNRTDVSRIKQFLSLRADRFRAAYGRHVKEMPRCCVFFGSTNNGEYLRDKTGNRRFWPVDVGLAPAVKSVFTDLDGEVDQLWAEAVYHRRAGEPLYLSGEVEEYAKQVQEDHREQSPREGIIREFLGYPVPSDWGKWDLARRMAFWSGTVQGDVELVERDRVCALEVWCEALNQDMRFIRNSDAAEINSIIAMVLGWEKMRTASSFGYCKQQRGFKKQTTK